MIRLLFFEFDSVVSGNGVAEERVFFFGAAANVVDDEWGAVCIY